MSDGAAALKHISERPPALVLSDVIGRMIVADTREEASETHGSRMRSVTSSPSTRTRSPSSSRTLRATSAGSAPSDFARQATARYIAPESR